MSYSASDRRRVYLACRAIFTGNNAQLRRQKKVKLLIDKRRSHLAHIIHDLGLTKVVEVSRLLLENGVFQSDLRAKVEFPELFISSPNRDALHAESEHVAARSVAEALEEVASLGDVDEGRLYDEDEADVEMSPRRQESCTLRMLWLHMILLIIESSANFAGLRTTNRFAIPVSGLFPIQGSTLRLDDHPVYSRRELL